MNSEVDDNMPIVEWIAFSNLEMKLLWGDALLDIVAGILVWNLTRK